MGLLIKRSIPSQFLQSPLVAVFSTDQYELVDFGEGRKLERFGPYLLDRLAPVVEDVPRGDAACWKKADARYERTRGEKGVWRTDKRLPDTWSVQHGSARFQLKRTDFGHVGLFPEQASLWDWVDRQVRRAGRPLNVLNLFAYTGGSTLAAAAAGARVVHVDAARNVVRWARRSADLSGLAEAPIRWIAEDATRFVERELRRGNDYDAVILDPPTYGHGPKGEVWRLADHFVPLLEKCGELTRARRAFFLVTCHTPGFGPPELEACLADALFGHCQGGVQAGKLRLKTSDGRRMPAGAYARWPG
jgi:23S rRNA (cytosine1962-C5)-methyltransferase